MKRFLLEHRECIRSGVLVIRCMLSESQVILFFLVVVVKKVLMARGHMLFSMIFRFNAVCTSFNVPDHATDMFSWNFEEKTVFVLLCDTVIRKLHKPSNMISIIMFDGL
jgi:hypothetical protein